MIQKQIYDPISNLVINFSPKLFEGIPQKTTFFNDDYICVIDLVSGQRKQTKVQHKGYLNGRSNIQKRKSVGNWETSVEVNCAMHFNGDDTFI